MQYDLFQCVLPQKSCGSLEFFHNGNLHWLSFILVNGEDDDSILYNPVFSVIPPYSVQTDEVIINSEAPTALDVNSTFNFSIDVQILNINIPLHLPHPVISSQTLQNVPYVLLYLLYFSYNISILFRKIMIRRQDTTVASCIRMLNVGDSLIKENILPDITNCPKLLILINHTIVKS